MTGRGWWDLTARAGRVQELDAAECLTLLQSTHVGRLGYVKDDGLRIVPLNYALAGERLLVRTGLTSEPARLALGSNVAFEVDLFDEFLESGWSVLVTGRLETVDEQTLRVLDLSQTPQPWKSGQHALVLQLPLIAVTGRRILQS